MGRASFMAPERKPCRSSGDVGEAERLETLDDALATGRILRKAGQLGLRNFDAGNRAVMADAQFTEPFGA